MQSIVTTPDISKDGSSAKDSLCNFPTYLLLSSWWVFTAEWHLGHFMLFWNASWFYCIVNSLDINNKCPKDHIWIFVSFLQVYCWPLEDAAPEAQHPINSSKQESNLSQPLKNGCQHQWRRAQAFRINRFWQQLWTTELRHQDRVPSKPLHQESTAKEQPERDRSQLNRGLLRQRLPFRQHLHTQPTV